MRTWLVGLLGLVATCGLAQGPSVAGEGAVRIDRLTIQSQDLPDADKAEVEQAFARQQYPANELRARIQQALRDRGYFYAMVKIPQVTQEGGAARVEVTVTAHHQYRLGEIQFVHNTVLPSKELRQSFHIEDGSLFSATRIGEGLMRVQRLYQDRGYQYIVTEPTPIVNEAERRIDLQMDVDEGQPN